MPLRQRKHGLIARWADAGRPQPSTAALRQVAFMHGGVLPTHCRGSLPRFQGRKGDGRRPRGAHDWRATILRGGSVSRNRQAPKFPLVMPQTSRVPLCGALWAMNAMLATFDLLLAFRRPQVELRSSTD